MARSRLVWLVIAVWSVPAVLMTAPSYMYTCDRAGPGGPASVMGSLAGGAPERRSHQHPRVRSHRADRLDQHRRPGALTAAAALVLAAFVEAAGTTSSGGPPVH